ncbi:MAG TPA: OmpA family protein [Edaphocola sp.]|nr:OmpA family protein [Edaphocola sp.]
MKKLFQKYALLLFVMFMTRQVHAQLWNKVSSRVKQTVENHIVNKSGDVAGKAMDASEKKVVETVKSDHVTGNDAVVASMSAGSGNSYKNYDFVPGDKIIFQPDLSGEEDAELPARFTIKAGTAEIQSFDGEKVLHLEPNAKTAVEPLMSSDKYLPEQFTLEFDVLYENNDAYFKYVSNFRVAFCNSGDQNYYNGGLYAFVIDGVSRCSFGTSKDQDFPPALQQSFGTGNTWHHIAIYVRKNIGKAYIDAYRVCATNALPEGADRFYIKADRYGIRIKNMRLAAGGADKYNKIVTDGKIITHGILFEVNKSTIKPESMGTLNELTKLMKEHSDLKFEIDGHTDSDGNDDTNMKLSQARADAVRTRLIKMGIDGSRLTAKGFGETKPIDSNATAEGKANNRRVEFVKI